MTWIQRHLMTVESRPDAHEGAVVLVWVPRDALDLARVRLHPSRIHCRTGIREPRDVKVRALEQSRARFRFYRPESSKDGPGTPVAVRGQKTRAGPLSQPRPAKP